MRSRAPKPDIGLAFHETLLKMTKDELLELAFTLSRCSPDSQKRGIHAPSLFVLMPFRAMLGHNLKFPRL